MDWLWNLFSTTTSTLMWIAVIAVVFYFGGPIATVLGKISEPVGEWVGKTAPELLQGLWDGIKGLSNITLKTAIVLALLGGGLYLGGQTKCNCQVKVDKAIKDLRKDYRFVPRVSTKKTSGGFFNVF